MKQSVVREDSATPANIKYYKVAHGPIIVHVLFIVVTHFYIQRSTNVLCCMLL